MEGKGLYYKRKLHGVRVKLFGDGGVKGALLAPAHGERPLLSRLLPGWAAKTLRVAGWVSLPLYPLFCLFLLDYMNYRKLANFQAFLEEHPGSFVFECLVMLALFAGLMLLVRRGAVAAGIMGAVSAVFGYINYMKYMLNGDYFQPRDFSMVSQARELAQFISGDLPRWYYLGVLVIVLWTAYFALCGTNLPLRWTVRFPVLALGIAVTLASFSTSTRSNAILSKFNMNYFDAALQTSNYKANGFVGAFTVNLLMNRIEPPEGYTRENIDAIMAPWGDGVTEGGESYDVIVVLSESFFDVRTLPGVEFSENPLPNYDRIVASPNAYSGYMFTTASGGGTVRPEFEILTGLSTDYLHDVASPYELVDGPVESFVSNYKDAGYRAVAIHPYDASFYRRNAAYPYLGFDEFLDHDAVAETVTTEYKRGLVTDETTFNVIKYELERADTPMFIEAITMQNHQPFNKLPEDDISITVTGEALDPDTLDAVTTYTQGLADADRMLGMLADYIDSRENPTVLLFYGDHLPTIGKAYDETGIYTPDNVNLTYRYSTPFVIYTNTGAESGLLDRHTDNEISTYYLLEVVAEMTGFRQTPYMRMLADFHSRVPYYNVRLTQIERTQDVLELVRAHELITYDRIMGRRWSTVD